MSHDKSPCALEKFPKRGIRCPQKDVCGKSIFKLCFLKDQTDIKNVSNGEIYVCAMLGQRKGVGMHVPSRDQIRSWHVTGHFIENTMLQVGVHIASPLEEGTVG